MKSTIASCLSASMLLAFAEGCSDSGAGCPRTVAEQCAIGDPPAGQFGVRCLRTLAAAEQEPTFCGVATESTCGPYTVVKVLNVDFSYLYYYDASGALAAVASDGFILGMKCQAGASTFAFPTATCSDPRRLSVCPVQDAGTTE